MFYVFVGYHPLLHEMLRRENYSDADFSFLRLNIRSLPHNLVKLTDHLSCLNIKFSVIGI